MATAASLSCRGLNLEVDAPALARLYSAARPEKVTLDEVRDWWQPRQGELRQTLLALNEAGQPVGMVDGQHTASMRAGHFWLNVIVDPGWRRQGVGGQLFAKGLAWVQAQGGQVLESTVWDNRPEALQFAERRGFRINRQSFDSVLDLTCFEESRFAGLLEKLYRAGFRFFSLAEVGPLTEESKRRLYEVNKVSGLDNPGNERTFPSFEDFSKNVFAASWFRAENQLLAAHEDRWVGLSAIAFYPEGNYAFNAFTGVLPEYRGRGLATALKLQAIGRARAYGAGYIRTNNDSQNAPMLAVNRKLGYQAEVGRYHLVAEVGEARIWKSH